MWRVVKVNASLLFYIIITSEFLLDFKEDVSEQTFSYDSNNTLKRNDKYSSHLFTQIHLLFSS